MAYFACVVDKCRIPLLERDYEKCTKISRKQSNYRLILGNGNCYIFNQFMFKDLLNKSLNYN